MMGFGLYLGLTLWVLFGTLTCIVWSLDKCTEGWNFVTLIGLTNIIKASIGLVRLC